MLTTWNRGFLISVLHRFPKHYLSLFIYAFVLFIYIFFDSKLPWGQGLGWDGAVYGKYVMCLPDCLFGIDAYHIHRLLIPALAKVLLGFLNFEISPANIASVYVGVDYFSLVGCYYYALALLRKKSLEHLEWLLLSAFIGYPFLKGPSFYPVLSDYAAAFICTWGYYYFQKNKLIVGGVAALLGFFAHAFIVPIFILLFSIGGESVKFLSGPLFSTMKAFGYLFICVIVFFVLNHCFHDPSNLVLVDDLRLVVFALPLTFLFVFMVYGKITRSFQLSPEGVGILVPGLRWSNIITLFGVYGVCTFFKSFFPAGMRVENPYALVLFNLVAKASERPLHFLESNFLYFGPLYIILIVMFLSQVPMNKMSVRQLLLIGSFLFLSLCPESRINLFMWPITLVTLLELYGERVYRNKPLKYATYFFAGLFSQAFLPTFIAKRLGESFLAKTYFLYHGGFQSIQTYCVLLVFTIIFMAYCFYVLSANWKTIVIPRAVLHFCTAYLVLISCVVYLLNFTNYSDFLQRVLLLSDRNLFREEVRSLEALTDFEVIKGREGVRRGEDENCIRTTFNVVTFENIDAKILLAPLRPGATLNLYANGGLVKSLEVSAQGLIPSDTPSENGVTFQFTPRVGVNQIAVCQQLSTKEIDFSVSEPSDLSATGVHGMFLQQKTPTSYLRTFPYYLLMYNTKFPFYEFKLPISNEQGM